MINRLIEKMAKLMKANNRWCELMRGGNHNQLGLIFFGFFVGLSILFLRSGSGVLATGEGIETHSKAITGLRENTTSVWWDEGWPYRIPVTVEDFGTVQANVDFGDALGVLGLNHAIVDIRSLRVVPINGDEPGDSLSYAESYSVILEDAENPQIGWSPIGVFWDVNDGDAIADGSRFTQGSGSLKATIENWVDGYGYPGVELRIASGSGFVDWSQYEVFVYDVWPEVNQSALDQAPDLYWFKLYNACDGSPVTQGGPPLELSDWNYVSVSLNPLDSCWPSDGLDLSNINRMEFHTRDNATVNGNGGLWDDGDELTLWLDNLRLVDQNYGSIRWNTIQGVSDYYIYFDVLTHEGHDLPRIDNTIGDATTIINIKQPEAGGYYHKIIGVSGEEDMDIWTAPTVEKITPAMVTPVSIDRLRIAAARGEFEPFQLVVKSVIDQKISVNVSDFSLDRIYSQQGGIINSGAVEIDTSNTDIVPSPSIHRVEYLELSTAGDHFDRIGPWPDPLWPISNGEFVDLVKNRNQVLWFTVQVPWNASAGIYRSDILIGNKSVPVELEVWDFSLPREIHLLSEWGFSWSHIVEDVYQGYGDWDCYWEMVEAFKQDFINHRLIPKGVAWPAGLNYPGGVEYDCNGNLDPDAWGEWDFDTIGGKYIHGEAGFNDGYGFPTFMALGPTSNSSPNSLPYSFCDISRQGVLGSAAYQQQWGQYLSAVDRYIASDGYDESAYYHIVNEPQSFEDYTIVGQISSFTESFAPNYRQMVSEQVEDYIYDYPGAKIDIWMPTISNYERVKSQVRQRDNDEDVWWYYLYGDDPPLPNPILMSHPGIEARITPWLAWAERIDGLLHYSTTDWSPNPWGTPNVTGMDNGDGYFFYPPRMDGSNLDYCGQNDHRLVPSIRWENLRDGMEDYEYLWLLIGSDPQIDQDNLADTFVDQIVQSRTKFSRVPTDLGKTRAALAAAILGLPTKSIARKVVYPTSIFPGDILTYTLSYTHIGVDTSVLVTDTVPTQTKVLKVIGPGSISLDGQHIQWQADITSGQTISLTIRASAMNVPGWVVNYAEFLSTEIFTKEVKLLIFDETIFLPQIYTDLHLETDRSQSDEH
jgi:hypothetical protein